MPTYISLCRYTREGVMNIKDSPARLEKVKELFKSVGGEMKAMYLTMGQYDLVVIGEAVNDEAIAKVTLAAASGGAVSTETLRAFTEEEYRNIIAGLP